jgi:YD repeat-containing protein
LGNVPLKKNLYVTTYGYDVLNHLTSVNMTRPSGSQTRTFTYDSNQRLWKATNPENGTMTYTYNADGTLATKIDAKGQKVAYSYDPYQRIATIQRYLSTGSLDPCQGAAFTWDQQPSIPGSQNGSAPYGG